MSVKLGVDSPPRSTLERFMNEFIEAKKEAFAKNPFGDFVRKDIPEVIYNTNIVERGPYQIKGSIGQTNWVNVP